MNLALRLIGLEHEWRSAPEDFREAWAGWLHGEEMAELLVRVGFLFEDVVAPVRKALEAVPELKERIEPELRWGTPEAAHNAVGMVHRAMGDDTQNRDWACGHYRERFPVDEVARRLLAYVEGKVAGQALQHDDEGTDQRTDRVPDGGVL